MIVLNGTDNSALNPVLFCPYTLQADLTTNGRYPLPMTVNFNTAVTTLYSYGIGVVTSGIDPPFVLTTCRDQSAINASSGLTIYSHFMIGAATMTTDDSGWPPVKIVQSPTKGYALQVARDYTNSTQLQVDLWWSYLATPTRFLTTFYGYSDTIGNIDAIFGLDSSMYCLSVIANSVVSFDCYTFTPSSPNVTGTNFFWLTNHAATTIDETHLAVSPDSLHVVAIFSEPKGYRVVAANLSLAGSVLAKVNTDFSFTWQKLSVAAGNNFFCTTAIVPSTGMWQLGCTSYGNSVAFSSVNQPSSFGVVFDSEVAISPINNVVWVH